MTCCYRPSTFAIRCRLSRRISAGHRLELKCPLFGDRGERIPPSPFSPFCYDRPRDVREVVSSAYHRAGRALSKKGRTSRSSLAEGGPDSAPRERSHILFQNSPDLSGPEFVMLVQLVMAAASLNPCKRKKMWDRTSEALRKWLLERQSAIGAPAWGYDTSRSPRRAGRARRSC